MTRGMYILKCIAWGLIAIALVGLVTMLLWNWLIPTIFRGPELTYVQAIGLLVLSKILFWGFGGKRYSHQGGTHWKHRFYEKFSSMSPADREAFKQKMKEKWCRWEEQSPSGSSAPGEGSNSNV